MTNVHEKDDNEHSHPMKQASIVLEVQQDTHAKALAEIKHINHPCNSSSQLPIQHNQQDKGPFLANNSCQVAQMERLVVLSEDVARMLHYAKEHAPLQKCSKLLCITHPLAFAAASLLAREKQCSNCVWNSLVFSYLASHGE